MGKPAARVGDMHTCPMTTGTTPHVGGPIAGPGVPTVFISGQPAAVVGDMATCVGPPDTIAMGSSGVFIGGKPAARQGDRTVHAGTLATGSPTVLIGEISAVEIDPSKKSWVEVLLRDQDNKPLVGEEIAIELQDGSIVNCVTNPRGKIRIEGIDPGSCKVRFPNLDESSWSLL